jgi:hypothetical protein
LCVVNIAIYVIEKNKIQNELNVMDWLAVMIGPCEEIYIVP